MKVQIINKSHHQLPQYATIQSAGVDLRANLSEPIVLAPMQRALIPTGLYISLPAGYEAQVRLSKRVLQCSILLAPLMLIIEARYASFSLIFLRKSLW